MRYVTLICVPVAAMLSACAVNPPATGLVSNAENTTQRRAMAIENNRVEAARAASGEAKDPWRHMRPRERF